MPWSWFQAHEISLCQSLRKKVQGFDFGNIKSEKKRFVVLLRQRFKFCESVYRNNYYYFETLTSKEIQILKKKFALFTHLLLPYLKCICLYFFVSEKNKTDALVY